MAQLENQQQQLVDPYKNSLCVIDDHVTDDQQQDHARCDDDLKLKLSFEELPLEIRVHIMWYCSDESLMAIGQTSRFYNHLIFRDDDTAGDDDIISGYRNTIWKARLLGLLNRWIDEANSNIIDKCIDTSQLENLSEKTLDSYIEKQVFHGPDFKYSHLVMQLQKITFKTQQEATNEDSETGVTIRGRFIRNNNVKDWNSFLCNNYFMTNNVENLSMVPFSYKGYEIIINEYHPCQNSWRILFGIGTDFERFNIDKSTTQFLKENKGMGYILDNRSVKIFSYQVINNSGGGSAIIDTGDVKVGDRYALSIDFEKNMVYFFRNGNHIMTITSCIEDIAYHPVIALCPKKSITIYPLLSCEYPLNPNTPQRTHH